MSSTKSDPTSKLTELSYRASLVSTLTLCTLSQDLDSNTFPAVRVRCKGGSENHLSDGILCALMNAHGAERPGSSLGRVASTNSMYSIVVVDKDGVPCIGNSMPVLGDIFPLDCIELQV